MPFVQGYGVEMGLLIDVWRLAGPDAIAQVDLGVRVHRNRPLHELSSQATEVLQAALHRADRTLVNTAITLRRPGFGDTEITMQERPPLIEVPGYFRHGPEVASRRKAATRGAGAPTGWPARRTPPG